MIRSLEGRTAVEVLAGAFAAATFALVTSHMLATLLLDRVDDETWTAFEQSSVRAIEDARALCGAIASPRAVPPTSP